jgi:hypothetical protein
MCHVARFGLASCKGGMQNLNLVHEVDLRLRDLATFLLDACARSALGRSTIPK